MSPKTTSKTTTAANDNAQTDGGGSTALATSDELDGLDIGDDTDGLGEVDADDFRDAALVLNFKGQDKSGRAIPVDVFYNTLDETTHGEINAVFCMLHKSNLYSRFNKGENKTEIICRSYDRVTGTMFNGTVRPCEGCPDAVWGTIKDDDGKEKRHRNCSPVYNVFGVNRDSGQPFVVRFKKTALPVIKTHLQKHHLGRRVVQGKRLNYPLYSFGVRLSAKMAGPKATYAVPVIERTSVLPIDEIRAHAANTTALNDRMRTVLQKLEDQVEARERGEDTSFDTDKMAAAEGQDFVDAEGEQVA